MQLVDAYTFLFHRIAETDRDTIILQSIVVNCNTVRSSDSILATIALADRILFIILATEIEAQHLHDLLGLFRQTVFLHQRQYSELDRRQRCGQL